MALYTSNAVDGPGGISSLTHDPLKPVEHGVEGGPGKAGLAAGSNPATAVAAGAVLRVIDGGSGYATANNLATTTTVNNLNVWSGQATHNPALTTITVDITAVDGRIVRAVVNTGAAVGVGYQSGDWIQVTQGANTNARLEITTPEA